MGNIYKHLFFDDKYLFEKQNVIRKYGQANLIEDGIYLDKDINTSWGASWYFKLDDGKMRVVYSGKNIHTNSQGVYVAISEDGIHFKPEDVTDKKLGKQFPLKHQIMSIESGEVACIFEDKYCTDKKERYKMLFSNIISGECYKIVGELFVSPDLLHWTKVDNVQWSDDGEPITGVFYNDKKGCYTITRRRTWGVRLIGYIETNDWKEFTPFKMCMQADSIDGDLEELYGMPVFPYNNTFIGFPLIYGDLHSCLSAKYDHGTMKAQLAYSNDGEYWCRSLREPFISGVNGDKSANEKCYAKIVWPSGMIDIEKAIYIYGCASLLEHGACFHAEGLNGRIFIYTLRKDGFIKLQTADVNKESVVATRENIWNGGEVSINIKAKKATMAVYETGPTEESQYNPLGIAKPLDGYTHEDCICFEGDDLKWVPKYKTGKTLDELKGKTIVFEIKFEDGELYSIFGEMIPIFGVPADRYRIINKVPNDIL